MDERTQGALLLAVGGICLRLGFSDAALAYVKPSIQIPIALAGGVLLALGGAALLRALRAREGDEEEEVDHAALHGYASLHADDEPGAEAHEHTHGPGVAWLLTLPLLALLLIAPPPLGSFAAERQSARPPQTTQTSYPPLPAPTDGAVDLLMSEYIFRALYDEARSLEGARVRLSGFVTPGADGDGYLLTRFVLNCCAADATALSVQVVGDQPRDADTWLEVEGEWQPRAGHQLGTPSLEPPLLRALRVTPIEPPSQPYEY